MYKEAVKACLSQYTRTVRQKLGWSQEQMAEYLRISPRAYGDLERGKFCFSSWSLLFLLRLIGKDDSWELIALTYSHIEAIEVNKNGKALNSFSNSTMRGGSDATPGG